MKLSKALIREDLKDLKIMLKKANETGLPQMGLSASELQERINEINYLLK
jgi:hypothetical protein